MRKLTEDEIKMLRSAKDVLRSLQWDLADESNQRDEIYRVDELVINTAKISLDYMLKDYK